MFVYSAHQQVAGSNPVWCTRRQWFQGCSASGPFLFSESGTFRAHCCCKVPLQAHSGRTVLRRIRSATSSCRYLTRRPICTYGSPVLCALQAFRVLTGITRISAASAGVSSLAGVAVGFSFVVFCVSLIPVPMRQRALLRAGAGYR